MAGEPIAEFSDYATLLAALRTAREHRQMSMATLDELAFLPDRLSSKILGPNPSRGLTLEMLPRFLFGLGVKVQLVDDPQAHDAIKNAKPARPEMARPARIYFTHTDRRWSKIRKKGPAVRWAGKTDAEKSKHGKMMARARWRRRDASVPVVRAEM